MASGAVARLSGSLEVDERVVGGQEKGVSGRKNVKKRLLVVGIERKGYAVGGIQAHPIQHAGIKELRPFFEHSIAPSASVRRDRWGGYYPLKSSYAHLIQNYGGYQGEKIKLLDRVIMMLKAYIGGIHHSVRRLQS